MRLFAGTELDRPPRCEHCGELDEDCKCPPEPPQSHAHAMRDCSDTSFGLSAPIGAFGAQHIQPLVAPDKQTARLSKEKRKKGKVVTVIRGLPTEGNDLPSLLKQLKSNCGAGGALQEDSIEIQGDQLDRVREELKKIGYKVKG